ncbi:MAG: aminotransferase class IV [Calditerrivibrio sp.]|nr:aminotransferase class IV [Calditerrivibrio sp.]
MYQFFETIKVENGVIFNLPYHQRRVNNTFKNFYTEDKTLNIEKVLNGIEIPKVLSKMRISYELDRFSIEISQYKRRKIEKIVYVFDDDIEYEYKYEDRSCFTKYKKKLEYPEITEPIFVVKGYLTDTTFSNIALFDGTKWFTPNTYLLRGTKREELIDIGKISVEEIKFKDIDKFEKISLINSLNGIGDIEISIK